MTIDGLNLNSGGQISTSTIGVGMGGNINLESDRVKIEGTGPLGNSGIFAVGVK